MPVARVAPAPLSPAETAYSLALLADYTHTLDALPLELSRSFADLRELDAVLASSMVSITEKITRLTALIEDGHGGAPPAGTAPAAAAAAVAARNENRLYLLADIADEASRLRPGSEDKIRVACQAADTVKAHNQHMAALLDHLPDDAYDGAVAGRQTAYPHVPPPDYRRAYVTSGSAYDSRKRRAAAAGVAIQNGAAAAAAAAALDAFSPVKRAKKLARDDDDAYGRSPRKKDVAEKARPGARAKKNERAASPAESLVSVTSHLLPTSSRLAAQATVQRTHSSTSAAGKRAARESVAELAAARARGEYLPATAHPSLGLGAPGGGGGGGGGGSSSAAREWVPSGAAGALLEGPGVPPSRNATAEAQTADEVMPDAEAEDDTRTYCICNGPGYGEMIGCDGDDCEREWFHAACLGLTSAPKEDQWYCDECKAKRARKGARGGRRKTANRKEK